MTINYERRFGSIPLPLCSWRLPERVMDAQVNGIPTRIYPHNGTTEVPDKVILSQNGHQTGLIGGEINISNIRLDNNQGLNRLFPLCVYTDRSPRHPKR